MLHFCASIKIKVKLEVHEMPKTITNKMDFYDKLFFAFQGLKTESDQEGKTSGFSLLSSNNLHYLYWIINQKPPPTLSPFDVADNIDWVMYCLILYSLKMEGKLQVSQAIMVSQNT